MNWTVKEAARINLGLSTAGTLTLGAIPSRKQSSQPCLASMHVQKREVERAEPALWVETEVNSHETHDALREYLAD